MDNLINEFFEYLKKRDSSLILETCSVADEQDMAVIILKILAWLKLERKRSIWKEEGKRVSHKPMKLSIDPEWCQELRKLVENERKFNYFFKISKKGLEFSDQISEEEREHARKKAYDMFVPHIME